MPQTDIKRAHVFKCTRSQCTKIASIGDKRHSDFLQHGDEKRRRLYKIRHERDRHKKGTAGYYADKILW